MLQVSKPNLGTAEEQAIIRVMRSGYLGQGPEVAAFEAEIQEYLQTQREVVAVGSGTAALHLALQAIGVGAGDEVLVPSLTFVASFQAISATGATAIACDIDPLTGLLDLQQAQRKITSRTKAVMPVHYASQPLDPQKLSFFAAAHRLRVIEDAAHSFGSRVGQQLVGSFGDVVCFSFDPIKNITCSEGGAVVTNDKSVAAYIRSARKLGLSGSVQDPEVQSQGWRYHMSDMMASIGRVQLKRFETEILPYRKNLRALYQKELATCPGLSILQLSPGVELAPHIFVIRLQKEKRASVIQALHEIGIETKIHYKPNHLLQKYQQNDCPKSENIYNEILTLPLHLEVTSEDVLRICSTITAILKPFASAELSV